MKRRLVTRAMSHAAQYTTWSAWTKASLTAEYGVEANAVAVIHPGATVSNFAPKDRTSDGKLKLLFVGGDFERKGGDVLLEVFERSLRDTCELHIATAADVPQSDGVFVYRGLRPHSAELVRLYAECDVFVLPTRGDCLAVVLGEAMAASMPIVTTNVGAHAEAVEHGESGFVIDPEDAVALRDSLLALVEDRALVSRMGRRAREIGEERFDMAKGATQIADMLLRLAQGERQGATITEREPATHGGGAS
jgi:glycosyltransferase involved in cell wall biosynthesis